MTGLLHCVLYLIILSICYCKRIAEPELSVVEHDLSKLRYIAFGTSVTYGSSIDRDKEAYIKVASNGKGRNLGIRASDPSFPSICTQSMIGDEMYDVIIVEYDRRYDMGLNPLVKRLRQRFVDATIIVVNIWTFMNVNVVDENDKFVDSFRGWLKMNEMPDQNTPETVEFVRNSTVRFRFDTNRLEKRDAYMNELVRDYNVKLLSWPWGSGNIKPLLLRYLPLYAEDFVHWSASGHRYAAININKIVSEEKTKLSNRVKSWGEGDVCDKWIDKGAMRTMATTNGKMVKFDDRYGGKFALEFNIEGGYIIIENPLNGPRELALTFMVTGPAPSIYPKTKISIVKSGQKPIIVDPTDTFYDYPVHVQQTLVVGQVNPGMNEVLFIPLETTDQPFRLVGYAITNESRNMSTMWERPMSVEEK